MRKLDKGFKLSPVSCGSTAHRALVGVRLGKFWPSCPEDSFQYNEADRVVKEKTVITPEAQASERAYLTTEYTYNELDRLVRKTVKKEKGTRVLEIEEDATFAYQRVLDATRMTSAKNNIANLEFKYEPQPPFSMREYSVASAQSGNPKGLIEGIFAINPDVTGEVGSVLYNDVNLFTAVYDQSGRMMGISSNYSNANYSAAVQRDGYGRKTRVTHSNGLVGNYGYDLLDRITNITWLGAGEDFSEGIEYNSRTGNISRITREFGAFSYGYNNLDELTSVAYSGSVQLPATASRNISYDYTGNRVEDNIQGAGKFLRNVILEDDIATYFHDEMGLGNLIQRTNKQTGTSEIYGYYKGGKLRTYKKIETRPIRTESIKSEYYYDALGRRISKMITTGGNTFTQSFAYLGAQDKILLGKNGVGSITLYLDGQGIDEHMGHVSASGVKYYVVDHIGSVLNTEVAGTSKSFSAWGELLTTGLPAISLISNPAPYAWQGKVYDPEYNSYFSRYRTYFQEIGRFGQRDLIWPKDHLNPYVYGQNNGMSWVDPWGLDSCPKPEQQKKMEQIDPGFKSGVLPGMPVGTGIPSAIIMIRYFPQAVPFIVIPFAIFGPSIEDQIRDIDKDLDKMFPPEKQQKQNKNNSTNNRVIP